MPMLDSPTARAVCRAQEYANGEEAQAIIGTLGLTEDQQALLYTRCMDVAQGYLDVEDVEKFYAEAMNEVR